jgi:hypothetical protein
MPFYVKDCALIARMAGIGTAMNLRELEERIAVAPDECLFHHVCETVIRPTFDDPEYHNDFAAWAARHLRDRVLAERLAIINPYKMAGGFDELRTQLADIIEERLSEVSHIPWAPPGHDFQFMRAVTVVFKTGMVLETPDDLLREIPHLSLSSIYYHFVEARRRRDDRLDDFTGWLLDFESAVEPLVAVLKKVDFYFFSLAELKKNLVAAITQVRPEVAHD